MNAPQPEPAWYPDPLDPERVRYWNGAQWSEETRPRWAESTPAPEVHHIGSHRVVQRPSELPLHGMRRSAPREATEASMSWRRLLAGMIDSLVCVPLAAFAAVPAWLPKLPAAMELARSGKPLNPDALPATTPQDVWWLAMASLLVWCVYGMFLTRLARGTVGQLVMGLRVTSASTTEEQLVAPFPTATWGESAKRSLLRGMVATLLLQSSLGLVLNVIGMLATFAAITFMNGNIQRRSLFDLAAGTRVVYARRELPPR